MSAIEKLGVDDVKIKELTSNNGTSNRVGDDQIDTTKRSRQNRKMAKAPKGVQAPKVAQEKTNKLNVIPIIERMIVGQRDEDDDGSLTEISNIDIANKYVEQEAEDQIAKKYFEYKDLNYEESIESQMYGRKAARDRAMRSLRPPKTGCCTRLLGYGNVLQVEEYIDYDTDPEEDNDGQPEHLIDRARFTKSLDQEWFAKARVIDQIDIKRGNMRKGKPKEGAQKIWAKATKIDVSIKPLKDYRFSTIRLGKQIATILLDNSS